ncbi:AAA family ATPase [Nonomuraea salmonea]|uniref:AAA family ATPase n=1 Tax=Nonomuraea salmonea TaxID=46181 RepID=UPI0031EFB238
MRQSRQAESGTLAEVPDQVLHRERDPETALHRERARAMAQHVLAGATGVGGIHEPGRDELLDDVLQAAVADVQRAKAVFTRYEVMRAINRHLPGWLGGLDAASVRRLLEELTERAAGPGNAFGVRLLNLPEVVEVPDELRRGDGSSAYVAPCAERFTTDEQLAVERRLLRSAQERTAPAVPRQRVEQWLAPRCRPEGRPGLREDQAVAILGIATSGRAVDVFEGPAGSGKSYTLGRLTGLWRAAQGVGSIGLTLSSNASYVLADEGFERTFNIRRFLTLARAGRLRIEPGTLIVVDEASMVPTADLAAIQEVADGAFCKVVWAGDTAQLSAPEAGGLMRVLAADAGSYALTVVERMEAVWEREASLRLRAGDVSVVTAYEEHGRLVEGDREQVMAQLVADYLSDRDAGRRAVMLTMSNADARELSARVRAELVTRGEVTADGIRLRDGTTAGVGDLVMARANTRRVNVAGTWRTLSNRDVLRIHRILPDGGLTAHLVTRTHPGGDPERRVHIPARYAARHLELGYAGTAHAAQGRTVDVARALIDGRVTHEMLYVMLTRGRAANVGYVDVGVLTAADLRPGTEQTPQLAQPDPAPGAPVLGARTVLAHVLERDDASPAAVEALREEGERVTHMAHLAAIWRDIVALATRQHHHRQLATALPSELYERLQQDPARRTLYTALHQAELTGRDTADLISRAARLRPLDTARSIAQVLRHRIARLMRDEDRGTDHVPQTWHERTPHIDDPELASCALEVADRMDQRTEYLGRRAAQAPPEWALRQLGEVPDEPLLRHEWIARAGVIAAYGEAYGTSLLADHRPGPPSSRTATWPGGPHSRHWACVPRPPNARQPAATTHRPRPVATTPWPRCARPAPCSPSPTPPHQVGLRDEAELADRAADLLTRAEAVTRDLVTAEERVRTYTASGGGPAERELIAKREELTRLVQRIDAATTAQEQPQDAGQARAEEHSSQETYRPVREQARHAETQVPPRTVWPLIRHQHAQLTRHWDDLLQRSRRADIRAAEQDIVTARTTRQEIRAELDAVQQEIARRATLSPERRHVEQMARDQHRARQRREELIATLAATPDGIGLLSDQHLAARVADLYQRRQALHTAMITAEENLARWTEHGGGPPANESSTSAALT